MPNEEAPWGIWCWTPRGGFWLRNGGRRRIEFWDYTAAEEVAFALSRHTFRLGGGFYFYARPLRQGGARSVRIGRRSAHARRF